MGNSIGGSNIIGIISTALVRGCVTRRIRFANTRGVLAGMTGCRDSVSIVTTASLRGFVINLGNSFKGGRVFLSRRSNVRCFSSAVH